MSDDVRYEAQHAIDSLMAAPIAGYGMEFRELQELYDDFQALYNALAKAIKYIDESPCDYDITRKQIEAWDDLQACKPKELLQRIS